MRDTRANGDETKSDGDVLVLGFFFRDRAGKRRLAGMAAKDLDVPSGFARDCGVVVG